VRIDASGVGIEVDVAGPDGGRPVLLLHGFPDSARLWRHQVPALAGAGFRVIAPDLRGFGRSDKPGGVDDYHLLHVAGDVLAVLDRLGVERAHVVGHDWGGALAWGIAALLADRVDHLVALATGHPTSFWSAGLAQRQRSWYMLLFQFPVAEGWLSGDGWAGLREWADTHPDIDGAIAAFGSPAALTAGLSWYRANIPPEAWVSPPVVLPPVEAPAMGVWSTGDRFLTEEQMTGSAAYCANGFRYERLEGVGHWMPLEAPDQLNALLLDFLPR
jgi:pimeloyl-ACP methyl ester carboxylesterase